MKLNCCMDPPNALSCFWPALVKLLRLRRVFDGRVKKRSLESWGNAIRPSRLTLIQFTVPHRIHCQSYKARRPQLPHYFDLVNRSFATVTFHLVAYCLRCAVQAESSAGDRFGLIRRVVWHAYRLPPSARTNTITSQVGRQPSCVRARADPNRPNSPADMR